MNPPEEEIVDELEDEPLENELPAETTEDTPVGPTLEEQLAEMRGRLDGKSSSDASMDKLLQMGQQFLETQNRPKDIAPDPAADDAALESFGKMLEEMVLLKTPKEKALFFQKAVRDIAGTTADGKIEAALGRYGSPMVDKLGTYAHDTFIDKKSKEYKDKPKLFEAISQHFKILPNEQAWLATASREQGETFMSARWRQAGGDALEASAARRAKASQLNGTRGGGGDNVIALPGSARDKKALEDLAMRMVPETITDPKERLAKRNENLKRMLDRMKREEATA